MYIHTNRKQDKQKGVSRQGGLASRNGHKKSMINCRGREVSPPDVRRRRKRASATRCHVLPWLLDMLCMYIQICIT